MNITLHDYRRCPFCIRVRMVLYLKNIEHKIVNEPLREWTPWMLEHVDKPRVPVLHIITASGEEIIMPESNDINVWLDENIGNKEFTPQKNTPAYQQMVDWWEWCGEIFKHQIDLFKYGENRIFDTEKHRVHTKDLADMIQKIEDHLQIGTYLIEDRLTLADIAIIPFIRQIMRTRNEEFDFSPYPRVLEWANSILEQEWFSDIVMVKHNT